MTPHRFRILLLLYAGIYLAALAAAAGPELAELATGSLPWIFSQPWLCAGVATGLIALAAAPVGLFFFQRWARPLALVTTAILLPLTYFPEEAAPLLAVLASALLEMASLLWGGILALAYFSPVAVHFSPHGCSSSSDET